MKRTKLQIDIIYRKDISMRTYHKVEIKRKDLYSKDYSKIKYSNIEGGENVVMLIKV